MPAPRTDRLLRTLADEVDGLVAVLDRDLRYVLVNHRSAERAGRGVGAVEGRTPWELVPTHAESIAAAVRPVLDGGGPVRDVPFRTTDADGRPQTLRADLVPVPGDDGAVEQVVVVMRDVSPLDRAETRRALAEAKLAIAELRTGSPTTAPAAGRTDVPGLDGMSSAVDMLFEAGGIAMVMVGFDGRVLRANRAFGRLIGRDVADLVGSSVTELTHPDDVAATEQRLEAGPELQEFEKRYLSADGEPVAVRITSWLVRDDEGEPVCNLGIAVPAAGLGSTGDDLAATRP